MLSLITVLFIVGYSAIALEHQIHLNKAASAILTGVDPHRCIVLDLVCSQL